jgi:hypothetical protein
MTSTSKERHSVITHSIGPSGTLVLRTVRGSVRVRGVDSEEARVEARYPGSTDPSADEQALRVTRTDDLLQIEVDDTDARRISQLARLFGDGRPRVDFDVTMPRTGSLRVSGVSADMDVVGLVGDHEFRTVSGDLRIADIGGSLSLTSVSGDASVTGTDLTVQASTTSGDLAVAAQTLHKVQIRSVSGDLRIAGALDPLDRHSAETISGDIELLPTNGVSISMTSVSGSIHSSGFGRPDQSRGRGSLVIGDGAASLSFRTMSGDLNVLRADPSASSPTAAADAPAAAAPSPPALPPLPPRPSGPALPEPPRPPVPHPSPAALSAAAEAPPPEASTASLATEIDVLRALERGEIDVTTAARLLEDKTDA